MSDISEAIYSDETKAREYLELLRWPNGVICPLNGCVGTARPLEGKSMGDGWYYCTSCKDKFTVRVGSIFERSHVPLHKWLVAFRLMASSKKGCSAHQIHRTLEVTYKTAWFMAHRIREAMRSGPFAPSMGGRGKVVESDETYIGQKKGRARDGRNKHVVLSLVERGGEVRSFHVANAKSVTIGPIVAANIARESKLSTDEGKQYIPIGKAFAGHVTVDHSREEYVRGEASTNAAEGFFSIFKRGMKGVYQHCDEKHLHRYLAEFDFRYNNRIALGVDDTERTDRALRGAIGRRLTYQGSPQRLRRKAH